MTKNIIQAAYAPFWAHLDLNRVPDIKVIPPGPLSKQMHKRCTKYFKGLSGQVKLFPVVFDYGKGCELVDVDGNRYIDFSSGIYVTTLGKGFGNGFPVTCVAVRGQYKESFESISASISYDGNPMACAAALVSQEKSSVMEL